MTLNLASCSDSELTALAVANRRDAYSTLMQRHQTYVFRLIRSLTGDADAALDLSQETFVAAFLGLGSYDPQRSFRTWLSKIAINKCRDWGRKRAVRRFFTFAAPIEAADAITDDTVAADDALASRIRLAAVSRAVQALPAKLKEPLILCAVDGHSQAEAAELLGISEKAVETRIRRARAALANLAQ